MSVDSGRELDAGGELELGGGGCHAKGGGEDDHDGVLRVRGQVIGNLHCVSDSQS